MVRFLMYSSDYDVIGIVQNNSIFQKNGHSKDKWIEKMLVAYGEVLSNLKKHEPAYPEAATLLGLLRVGNENSGDLQKPPPQMATKDTPGSELIIERLLDQDPRPVHIPCWGGANTVAYALWKLKSAHPKEEFDYAVSRLIVYGITYNLGDRAQDGGYQWIVDNVPEVKIYTAASWARTWSYDSVDGKRNPSFNPKDVQVYMDDPWVESNVKSGHGPLGAAYPQSYVSEGDTPSFLNLINNGLEAHLDYTLGGWGGRAKSASNGHMVDAQDDGTHPEHKAVYRWTIAAQNDFAARMDWSVASDFSGANHRPQAKVGAGSAFEVASGASVTLDATESSDPDGDTLSFQWWQYHEADSANAKVSIAGADSKTASFTAPNEAGKEVHVVLEVTDNGTPPLKGYQRVRVKIK